MPTPVILSPECEYEDEVLLYNEGKGRCDVMNISNQSTDLIKGWAWSNQVSP